MIIIIYEGDKPIGIIDRGLFQTDHFFTLQLACFMKKNKLRKNRTAYILEELG